VTDTALVGDFKLAFGYSYIYFNITEASGDVYSFIALGGLIKMLFSLVDIDILFFMCDYSSNAAIT